MPAPSPRASLERHPVVASPAPNTTEDTARNRRLIKIFLSVGPNSASRHGLRSAHGPFDSASGERFPRDAGPMDDTRTLVRAGRDVYFNFSERLPRSREWSSS